MEDRSFLYIDKFNCERILTHMTFAPVIFVATKIAISIFVYVIVAWVTLGSRNFRIPDISYSIFSCRRSDHNIR